MDTAIRRAEAADQETVVNVLTEAFADDPLVCWLFPNPSERRRLQARVYRHHLADPAAETYLVGRREGVALWHSPPAGGAAHEEDPEPQAPDMEAAFGASASRLRALEQALAPRRPTGEPHLYLFCMGVAAGRRGAGLGSAILRHRLERADADGLAAYLEASSPQSRALYLRHGFEDLGEPARPADGPPLWPMWRSPHP